MLYMVKKGTENQNLQIFLVTWLYLSLFMAQQNTDTLGNTAL